MVNKKKCDICPFIKKITSGTIEIWICTFTKRKDKEIPFKSRGSSPKWCKFRRRIKTRRKKSPRALLVKVLDDLWRQVVRKRANYKCEITGQEDGVGQGKVLNAHHVIGRSNFRLRWNPDNGVLLTAGKHTLSCWSAHKNSFWFAQKMIERRGQSWYDNLRKEAGSMGGAAKHSIVEMEEIKKKLEGELNG